MDFNHVRPHHLCHPIEKVVEKHREALQSCCDLLGEKQAEGAKSLKNVADAEKALKKTAENAKAKISQQKIDFIKAAEDDFQSKINAVDQLYAAHRERLTEQRNKAESFMDRVKCATNLSKNVLEKGSDEEIIESHKMVAERVEMVKKESESVKNLSKPASVDQDWLAAGQINTEMVLKLFGEGMIQFSDSMFVSSGIIALIF